MSVKKSLVLFLVDGMRPDGLAQAETPTFDRMIAAGASTLEARTVMPSSTLPCHMSLFHSVPPGRHGIASNTYTPQVRPVPGLIETIKGGGGATAMFYNWEELRDLSRPDHLDASFYFRNAFTPEGDMEIADHAIAWMANHEFAFAFVYFNYTDFAGHAYGWMSEQYLAGITNADRCIGRVIDSLPEDTILIATSDHGGHEFTHGTPCDEDMTTPLIINAPAVRPGSTISGPVSIMDIAPTILAQLGIPAPAEWSGTALDLPG